MTIPSPKTSSLRNQFITFLALFSLLFSLFMSSCKDDDPPAAPADAKTEFYMDDVYSQATLTSSNRTKWGEILKVSSDKGDIYFILSDTTQSTYSHADTLFGNNTGKVKCILNADSHYSYSTEATLNYDRQKKSGTFSLSFQNIMIKKGILSVDTVIWKSCIDFTKISQTDAIGVPMNTPDPNDWVIRGEWDDPLEAQFIKLKDPITTPWGNYAIAFPNPTKSSIILSFNNATQGLFADCMLVNQNMEVEQVFTNIQASEIMLHFNYEIYGGNYYRLYTRLYNSGNSYYGSGDLKFQ